MNEDSIYRASTQYRLWSFTPQSLQALRTETNHLATARVQQALKAESQASSSTATSTAANSPSSNPASEAERNAIRESSSTPTSKGKRGGPKAVEPITVEEELAVVKYYCERVLDIGDEFKPPLPSAVRATAIQYLHRFYLTTSTQMYDPVRIMKCALFFACKTENHYLDLDKFLAHFPGTTRSDILDLEYTLLRTLRYTMEIRHPFRGLEGGVMELLSIAAGEGEAPPSSPLSPAELQRALLAIDPLPVEQKPSAKDMARRINMAASKAKDILRNAAAMTDSYFLYTPSQIWFAALLLSDAPLFHFYLSSKFPSSPTTSTVYNKVLKTITACSELLKSYEPTPEQEVRTTLKSVGKRLRHFEKMWERVPKQGLKRDGEGPEGIIDERERKKRKLEREKGEREGDVFGGPIGIKDAKEKGNGDDGGGEWSD